LAGGTERTASERRVRDFGAAFAEARKPGETDETEARLGDQSTE